MESKTSPAGHERVVAIAHDIVVDVAEVGRIGGKRLLRHANPFGTLKDRELGTVDVMGFDESSIPRWVAGSRR